MAPSNEAQEPELDQDSGRIEIDPDSSLRELPEDEAESPEPEGEEISQGAPGDVAARAAELEQLRGESRENRDKWLRALAELENYRKRSRRELETSLNLANASLLRQLLEVLDDFERALGAAEDPEEGTEDVLLSGVRLIHGKLLEILRQNGVVRMEALGQPFDPNLHEAVSQISSEEYPPDHVAHVVQDGFVLNETILRPARVVVSS